MNDKKQQNGCNCEAQSTQCWNLGWISDEMIDQNTNSVKIYDLPTSGFVRSRTRPGRLVRFGTVSYALVHVRTLGHGQERLRTGHSGGGQRRSRSGILPAGGRNYRARMQICYKKALQVALYSLECPILVCGKKLTHHTPPVRAAVDSGCNLENVRGS